MKLWAACLNAQKDDEIRVNPAYALARSEAEALELVLKVAKEDYPPDEGWRTHQVNVVEVPTRTRFNWYGRYIDSFRACGTMSIHKHEEQTMKEQDLAAKFVFRCTTELRDQAKEKASRQDTSLSEVIRAFLVWYVNGELDMYADRTLNADQHSD